MRVENPVKLTPEVRLKLEQAAAIDAQWEEMAFYAGISKGTLYNWLESVDGLKDRLNELRAKPILKARQTVVSNCDEPGGARWYLERKLKKEFGPNIDMTTDGQKLQNPVLLNSPEITAKIKALDEAVKDEMEKKL
jgi:hypothetical protein